MKSVRDEFFRYLCQTSPEPIGLEVERAEGCYIWDRQGNQYLDFLSGIGVANVGHTNPVVARAIHQQAESYLHVMVYGEYIQAPQVELARKLAELLPPALSVTYFTNSGTEAVEGALKTARKFTRRPRFVCFDGAFHGDTFGSLSLGGNPLYRHPFEPLLPHVTVLPFDDIPALSVIDESVAAVVVEPVQAEAGVRMPQEKFLSALRQRCTDMKALLIFDEVVTGFGRTGKLFAFQHGNVIPDILVLAKALGGGMPLGAFIGTPEVMATLSTDPPLSHVTTFGGHPVSCAAGVAALQYLVENNLPEKARILGSALLKRLGEFTGRLGLKTVRGEGLLIGMEFADAACAKSFVCACFERGLILNWTLHRDTVVRLAPPLTVASSEIDKALTVMATALKNLSRG